MSNNKKILVADDEPDFVELISMRLEVNGFEVVAAKDGQEAIDKTKKENPDLLILDLMMPKLDGFEVCRMLKFDDNFRNLPIIVLSALDQQQDREKAIKAGADEYFIKPFDLSLLLTKIRDLIG
ncbi:MAG: response regulator [Candidatus Omnitrophica bacterium]|nr:response regulator [Candidatus Omnitrophota bacterium]MCF7877328.1 response regulator [Candidatus Omnitrophota bacterium]MCF7891798.1 response regulator [Candidatus Omnitrophota bacterium]MCF7898175.1 response regulator [Candidatus Omnitrophota bacterium]MCF7909161.1 response regulator [Candidatus Omnitrophota bacterium]